MESPRSCWSVTGLFKETICRSKELPRCVLGSNGFWKPLFSSHLTKQSATTLLPVPPVWGNHRLSLKPQGWGGRRSNLWPRVYFWLLAKLTFLGYFGRQAVPAKLDAKLLYRVQLSFSGLKQEKLVVAVCSCKQSVALPIFPPVLLWGKGFAIGMENVCQSATGRPDLLCGEIRERICHRQLASYVGVSFLRAPALTVDK